MLKTANKFPRISKLIETPKEMERLTSLIGNQSDVLVRTRNIRSSLDSCDPFFLIIVRKIPLTCLQHDRNLDLNLKIPNNLYYSATPRRSSAFLFLVRGPCGRVCAMRKSRFCVGPLIHPSSKISESTRMVEAVVVVVVGRCLLRMTRGQDFEKHFLSLSASAFRKYFGSSSSLSSTTEEDASHCRNNMGALQWSGDDSDSNNKDRGWERHSSLSSTFAFCWYRRIRCW